MPENILIVDDEETVRDVLSLKLAGDGYNCTTADSGENALAMLKGKEFHLILSDIRMSGMSGMELLKIVKKDYPDTAVIMITASVNIGRAIDALKSGAYDYITKPISLDELAVSVRNALEKRRLIIENRDYQKNLEAKVFEQTKEIRELLIKEQDYSKKLSEALNEVETTYHATLVALSMALDYRDNETEGHSQRVTAYSLAIANELGLDADELKKVQIGALLHDIGKIGVLDAILRKPGKLDEIEREAMKRHVQYGYDMLKDIKFLKDAAQIVLHHQERWDGTGYPRGLKEEEIVIGARIFAVADAYDAMTSDRPYRKALLYEDARQDIIRCSGTQFDPNVVDVFLKIPKENLFKIRDIVDACIKSGQKPSVTMPFLNMPETFSRL